jgi:hypothetical protein
LNKKIRKIINMKKLSIYKQSQKKYKTNIKKKYKIIKIREVIKIMINKNNKNKDQITIIHKIIKEEINLIMKEIKEIMKKTIIIKSNHKITIIIKINVI